MLAAALAAAELMNKLKGPGPFAVSRAPTTPSGLTSQLSQILIYHVVPGEVWLQP